MYYDKSMKRISLTFCTCLLCIWAKAQVTCEIRVDAHPNATTAQRVNYCLTQQDEGSLNNPGLVFSGVTPRHLDKPITQKPTAHAGHFNQGKIAVERTFVDTRQFPQWKNGTLSEQEIWATRRGDIEQLTEPTQQAYRLGGGCRKSLTQAARIKAGLQARQIKPGRRLRIVSAEEQSSPEPDDLAAPTPQEIAPETTVESSSDSAAVQPYMPSVPDAQEYVPATTSDVQEYIPAEPIAQPDSAGQEEVPTGTASYAPAN